MKLLVNYSKHIMTLNLSSRKRDAVLLETFYNEFLRATFGFKFVIGNAVLCVHYYINSRKVGLRELLTIGLNFYTGYFREIKASLNKNPLEFAFFKMLLSFFMAVKITNYILFIVLKRVKKVFVVFF